MVKAGQFVSCAINISPKQWKEFKVLAMMHDKKLGDAVAEAIELWMKNNKK